jgi:cytochrome oxidase assembly protein ShyY1
VRFLLSRRWFFFAVAVALAAYVAVLLGQWQFHRLEDRQRENAVITQNLKADPVPIGQVMSTDEATTHDEEWKLVTMTGTYDDDHTIVLKYQTRDSKAGVDVVTPLVGADGTAVLVDRGWLATNNRGNERPDTPAPADGTVTVTGFVRANATGGSTDMTDLSTRALSSEVAAEELPHELYVGFLDLHTQDPEPDDGLALIELPDADSEGPHFFYGLQWWFFGAMAIFGFFYLMYDEWKRARSRSEGAGEPAVDGEHDPTEV